MRGRGAGYNVLPVRFNGSRPSRPARVFLRRRDVPRRVSVFVAARREKLSDLDRIFFASVSLPAFRLLLAPRGGWRRVSGKTPPAVCRDGGGSFVRGW